MLKKLPNKNEFEKRPPDVKEINAARRMAKKVSARLFRLMEAKTVKRADEK